MLPVLVDLGIVKIYTVGIFLMLAFFWAMFWFWRNVKRTSFKEESMFDAAFISLAGGMVFARGTYIMLNYQEFGPHILKYILINGYPGLSIIGGLIGGFVTLLLVTKYTKDSFMEVVAYAIPSLFLALGIGKLGALLGGNTIGAQTNFPLAVSYVGYDGPRHIVALYEAILMFIGFFVSQKLMLTYRRDTIDVGSLFSFFVMFTSLNFMALDFLKDDVLYLLSFRFNVLIPSILSVSFGLLEAIKYKDSLKKRLQTLTKRKSL